MYFTICTPTVFSMPTTFRLPRILLLFSPMALLLILMYMATTLRLLTQARTTVSAGATFNYLASPAFLPENFNSQIGISTGNNFALQPIDTSLHDLYIGIIEDCQSAPGFAHTTYIGYVNNGVVPEQPVLIFIMDSALNFVSAVPPVTSQQGDSLIWSLATINPLQSNSITLITTISAGTQLGDIIQNTGVITPLVGDNTPNDNIDSSTFPVLGSFDPNFKTAKPNNIAGNQTYNPTQLEYTIQFQNTGTAAMSFCGR